MPSLLTETVIFLEGDDLIHEAALLYILKGKTSPLTHVAYIS